MDSAKKAISSFMSGDGAHRTSVEQDQRAAITEEHVQPHRHEEVTTAVDKEVHQHHHRTVVQPIQATEVLPEKHTHNLLPVTHKTVDHSNDDTTRSTLAADEAQYRSTSTTHDTTHTTAAAPTLAGQHVHHHVHEHVQPVIQRHVAAPEVVHTTVPIHETHNLESVHHDTKVLPAKTMDEFQKANAGLLEKTEGGVEKLLGKHEERRIGEYDGCAKDYVDGAGVRDGKITSSGNHTHSLADPTGTAAATAAATAMTGKSSSSNDRAEPMTDTTHTTRSEKIDNLTDIAKEKRTSDKYVDRDSSTLSNNDTIAKEKRTSDKYVDRDSNTLSNNDTTPNTTRNTRVSESAKAQAAAENDTLNKDNDYTTSSTGRRSLDTGKYDVSSRVPRDPTVSDKDKGLQYEDNNTIEGQTKRVSLKDKLNPFKDADGDGKKGIMS